MLGGREPASAYHFHAQIFADAPTYLGMGNTARISDRVYVRRAGEAGRNPQAFLIGAKLCWRLRASLILGDNMFYEARLLS